MATSSFCDVAVVIATKKHRSKIPVAPNSFKDTRCQTQYFNLISYNYTNNSCM